MRPITTAVLLAVGSELTTGETRDSNGGELAASLAAARRHGPPDHGAARRPRRR